MPVNQEHQAFDQAWGEKEVPGEVVVEEADAVAQRLQASEQAQADYAESWKGEK